jgi:RNA polymerase sigma-70 factor, ECF subfamily
LETPRVVSPSNQTADAFNIVTVPMHSRNDSATVAEFTRLYEGCQAWLYSYLLSLLRRPDDADEVLQDTAQVCWQKFDQYRPGTEFRAWACRIAHFKALKFRQQRQKSPLAFSELFFETVDEEAVVMADVLDARIAFLNDCMKKLPVGDRKLLRLRYADGATTKHVADSLGRSVQAVYRALVRVHDTLFRCIDQSMKEEGRR